MELTVQSDGTAARFIIQGAIDEAGAAQMKDRFQQLDLSSLKQVDIDMSNVNHIGSAGIGKLLLFYKNVATQGGTIRIISPQPEIRDLFRELKLESIFTIT
jgi:anti-sigma B factor antagonist